MLKYCFNVDFILLCIYIDYIKEKTLSNDRCCFLCESRFLRCKLLIYIAITSLCEWSGIGAFAWKLHIVILGHIHACLEKFKRYDRDLSCRLYPYTKLWSFYFLNLFVLYLKRVCDYIATKPNTLCLTSSSASLITQNCAESEKQY